MKAERPRRIKRGKFLAPVKIAVLIGGGSRLKALAEWAGQNPDLAEIRLVISFKPTSAGLEWAKEAGYPALYLPWLAWKKNGRSRQEFDRALVELLKKRQIELVVLAGWGLLLSPSFLEQFPGRVINIHPALLTETVQEDIALEDGRRIPVFRGNHALEDAWAAGVPATGCTVHVVTNEMDVGPVILRQEVPRLEGDKVEDLSQRVHAAEDKLYPRALEIICRQMRT